MVTTQEADRIVGATAYDMNGQKIGDVAQVYLDEATGQPEWMTVKTGLFGRRESFVPLAKAHVRDDDRVEIEADKDTVTQAPSVDPDQELSQDEEARLYQHYGMSYGDASSPSVLPEEGRTGTAEREYVGEGESAEERDYTGEYERSGDDAMTRSEERLVVGTTAQPTGRARLRKYVVTEPVEQTVQVRREEARIEREPITDANRDQAMSGPDISEAEHEVTLHTERPVVEKETVPVERVRLTTDEVTDEQKVSDELRKERIEAEGDISDRPGQ
jgi:uncharacterized protein (TIGR02271 family)